MRFYRILFALAALYNLAFGIWAGFFPLHFFHLFSLPPPLYPSIWACVGMIVGIYAIAYARVAWKPEDGDFLIALGLLGKILGPIGWLVTVRAGEWPSRTFFLVLCNDLIWWFPFLFYLLRNTPARGRILTFLLLAVHVPACLLLLAVRDIPVPILAQTFSWVLLWFLWVLSSLSLPAFLACFTLKLRRDFGTGSWIWAAFALAVIGVAFDLWGEAILLSYLPDPARSAEQIAQGLRNYNWFSAGTANGLYCLGGIFLSWIAWQKGMVRGLAGIVGILAWVVGFSLSVFGYLNHPGGIEIAGGATMALFLPWAAWVGWRL